MKLADVMGAAGLSAFAEVALLIFFAAFLGIVIYLFAPWRRRDARFAAAARMPLDDEHPQTPR